MANRAARLPSESDEVVLGPQSFAQRLEFRRKIAVHCPTPSSSVRFIVCTILDGVVKHTSRIRY